MMLSDNWFTEGYIDFELQKYRLLAYINDVKASFNNQKLYPELADLVRHYKNLQQFKAQKNDLYNQFPQQISRIEAKNLSLIYDSILKDDDLMAELAAITEFAIAHMKETIEAGAAIYEQVEHNIHMEPVGIVPLYKEEGYLLFKYAVSNEVLVYHYGTTQLVLYNETDKGITMQYVDTLKKSLTNTYNQLKLELVRLFRLLPNPAVFLVEYPSYVPLHETLLPITKRVLLQQLKTA
jgi:hypothetical protein